MPAVGGFGSYGSATPSPLRLGDYECKRLLGRGGTASVYEGHHVSDGSVAAVKVLHSHLAADAIVAARFLREARNLSRVVHPNVVEVLHVGTHEGLPYLVMSLVDGEDLSDHVRRFHPMSMHQVAECMLPVIAAVDAAHRAGVVHRDLKPANVRLAHAEGRRLTPKVIDFGLSKVTAESAAVDLTESGEAMGTVGYMAPEQLLSARRADERNDIYALGVMLFECATGRRPFHGRSSYELMHAILTSDVPRPSSIRADLPRAFDEIVLRAMRREPSERFATAPELGDAVRAIVSAIGNAPHSGARTRSVLPDWDDVACRVRVALVGRVILVHWLATPDAANVRFVVDQLAPARIAAGKPLVYCTYVPEGLEPPPRNVRRLILKLTPEMLESCGSIHTVQPGAGILPTTFRAAARAMVVAGGYGRKIFIHTSLEDFFASVHHQLDATESDVRLELARIQGKTGLASA